MVRRVPLRESRHPLTNPLAFYTIPTILVVEVLFHASDRDNPRDYGSYILGPRVVAILEEGKAGGGSRRWEFEKEEEEILNGIPNTQRSTGGARQV